MFGSMFGSISKAKVLLAHMLLGSLILLAAAGRSVFALDHNHSVFAEVLRKHTQAGNGLVDYASVKASPESLRRYLNELAAVTEDEFDSWSEPEQMAFLLNLYNAATIQLVADHYPVQSIKKIGSLFRSPWKLPVVKLWGKTITLDDLEHGIIRAEYREPRIHFALVCAAKGCPPLRSEPYLAETLSAQLEEQGRRFFAEREKNRIDAGRRTVYLSPILKWFKEDFTRDGKTLVEFAAPYFGSEGVALLQREGRKFKVRFTDYDWSLNDWEKKKETVDPG
jgi:hypothetical protein